MRHRVALLDPLVVPGRDDLATRGEHRADRYAAALQAGPGLAQGQRHHLPVGLIYLPVSHAGLRYRTRFGDQRVDQDRSSAGISAATPLSAAAAFSEDAMRAASSGLRFQRFGAGDVGAYRAQARHECRRGECINRKHLASDR